MTRRKGQGLTEYALILVLVAVVVIVIVAELGPSVGNVFSTLMLVFESDPENPPETPPAECYSTLLLPIMVGGMSIAVAVSSIWQKKMKEIYYPF